LSETGPYYAYGIFASEAVGRAADPEFVRELARFANELLNPVTLFLEIS